MRMRMSLFGILLIGLMVIASHVHAGIITGVNFSGPDDPHHPNIVQITIEGGFNNVDCDQTLAAIRNTDDRQHLISYALAAFVSKQPVVIVLNGVDKYFGTRCTISRISSM